jgi:hypothetical protein
VTNRFIITLAIISLFATADYAVAGSVGDFFKALGNSIAHPGQRPKSRPRDPPSASKRSQTKNASPAADYPPAPSVTPTPAPTAAQSPVRVALAPSETRSSRRDIPYAIPVPNKPGFVTSPYAPKQGLVDVRGFPSGTEVKDPYTGKIFLTP